MNPNLESAVQNLRKEAQHVFVEYDNIDCIILLSAGNNHAASICPDAICEIQKEQCEIAEKKHRFLHGTLFSISTNRKHLFRYFPESCENPLSLIGIEKSHSDRCFEVACYVKEIFDTGVQVQFDFFGIYQLEKFLHFKDFNFDINPRSF